jgi:hypothetical protein
VSLKIPSVDASSINADGYNSFNISDIFILTANNKSLLNTIDTLNKATLFHICCCFILYSFSFVYLIQSGHSPQDIEHAKFSIHYTMWHNLQFCHLAADKS